MNLTDGFGEAEVAEAKRLFSEARFVAAEKILGRTTPDDELRYDLAYLLWKTLRNRRAANTDINETRDVLDRVHRAAAALASELAPMLAHPGTNTLAADDAAFFLYLISEQWEPLEIEHVAERAASLSASATEALNKIGRAKDGGRPVDTERRALVAYLSGIKHKYMGKNTRYTFDPLTGKLGGRFFQLLKIFEAVVAASLNKAPPSDAEIKGLLHRTAQQVTKPPPKKHSSVTWTATGCLLKAHAHRRYPASMHEADYETDPLQ